jgi:hypothetical protein
MWCSPGFSGGFLMYFLWFVLVCPCFSLVFECFHFVLPWLSNGFSNGFLMFPPLAVSWFSNDFRCWSHDSPMVFEWFSYVFSHGFPLGFMWCSHAGPMVFQWFSHGCRMVSHGCPMLFLWFPMVFLCVPWFSRGFVMLCYVMLCYGMVCYVMPCHVMSCHVMSCRWLSNVFSNVSFSICLYVFPRLPHGFPMVFHFV